MGFKWAREKAVSGKVGKQEGKKGRKERHNKVFFYLKEKNFWKLFPSTICWNQAIVLSKHASVAETNTQDDTRRRWHVCNREMNRKGEKEEDEHISVTSTNERFFFSLLTHEKISEFEYSKCIIEFVTSTLCITKFAACLSNRITSKSVSATSRWMNKRNIKNDNWSFNLALWPSRFTIGYSFEKDKRD